MSVTAVQDPRLALGRAPEQLTLTERHALTGCYVALDIYTTKTLPLRRIQAIGHSVAECARGLRERGLDPLQFEYTRLQPPY